MGSFSGDEELPFFDASEEVALESDSDDIEIFDSNSRCSDLVRDGSQFDVWIKSPVSVKERRNEFLNWLEFSEEGIVSSNVLVDRIMGSSGAVLRNSGFEDVFSSSRCSNMSEEFYSNEEFVLRGSDLNGGKECNVNEFGHVEGLVDSSVRVEASNSSFGSSSSFQQPVRCEVKEVSSPMKAVKKANKGWLNRLLSLACILDKQGEAEMCGHNSSDLIQDGSIQRVRVRLCKKQLKELSALYTGQNIQAHEGSILTMKFSPDGQYLASAGEDGVVRLWQVVEDDRCDEIDIPDIDPSCLYFTINRHSELAPLAVDKEKMDKPRSLSKTSDSACVIIPPKVFRILENPLHEFHGHEDDVLDLSWSNNNYLISSSVDKTVRLWRVGYDHCLKVFQHSNYVTSVQFNPLDDNYFISGSIDGKVRIWGISGSQVVDWTDTREIVSAVSYRPDGKGAIVGSMTGNCHFYNISDNHLQLDARICLNNKKKSASKRITGFQFFPQDSGRILVTCADSQVRILQGHNVIGKYRGARNTGNQMCASLTSDGKHIISACEDSHVYVWNCTSQGEPDVSQPKVVKSSERFSSNASIAIPWSGMKHENSQNGQDHRLPVSNSLNPLPFSYPACFSLSQVAIESYPKGSATWPEEKLPPSSPGVPSPLHKSEYKFLKTCCQSTSSSHTWGMVIVTAGWDGRIRSFLNYGLPVIRASSNVFFTLAAEKKKLKSFIISGDRIFRYLSQRHAKTSASSPVVAVKSGMWLRKFHRRHESDRSVGRQ